MPGIIPVNHRESLPKGMQYPLKYSDIEAALGPFVEHDVFINALFSRCVFLAARTEENIKTIRYSLVQVGYAPTIPDWKSGPWDDVDAPILMDVSVSVSVSVSAIPTWLANDVTARRPVLRKLLCDQIPQLMTETLGKTPYNLSLTLRLDPARIQINMSVGIVGEAGSRESGIECSLVDLNRSF